MKNYYSILNVPASATTEEIKAGFRKLALLYHPDKNRDPLAHSRFVEIHEAYHTLRDPVKRAAYNYALYSAQPSGRKRPAVQTGSDILEESNQLARAAAAMDPFRVNLDTVSFRVRDILRQEHIAILLKENNAPLQLRIIQNTISALQLLPYPLALDCIGAAGPLAETYPEIRTEIQRFLSGARWQFYLTRYTPIAALLAAAVFIALIFFKGK